MAANQRATTIEIGLVVTGPEGARRDLRVVAEGDAPAQELFAALAAEVGAPTTAATRHGDELPRDAPVSELALRHGDEIRLDDAEPDGPRGTAELVVLGGLDSGRRIPLESGTHRIGRSAELAFDDPALSGEHLVLTIAEDGSATVADAGSRNGTLVEGVSLAEGEERELRTGEVVQVGRTLLGVTAPDGAAPEDGSHTSERTRFNRQPRVQRPLEEAVRPFAAPPTDPQRSRLPLGASLIPLALGVALYLWTKLPTMLLFSLLSPVMAVSTYVEDRRSGRKGFERARRSYRDAARRAGRGARSRAAGGGCSPPRSVPGGRRADRGAPARLEPNLWERRLDDSDFLELRVGSAERPSLLRVRLDPGGSEELRREVDELAGWYASVPAVPVTVPAASSASSGLCGPRERVDALARWLVAQAAALHSPRDLAISAAIDPERADGWDWLKWLPHVSPAGDGRLAADADGVRSVLEEIAASSRDDGWRRSRRSDRRAGADDHTCCSSWTRPSRPSALSSPTSSPAPASTASPSSGSAASAATCPARPARSSSSRRSPQADAGRRPRRRRDGRRHRGRPLAERARELALALAPVEDDEAGVGGGAVPSSVTLLELLGEGEIDADRVAARWRARSSGLGAIVGAGANGPFSIDLRADGPHGLVAGMTGAGKSELLQTLIAVARDLSTRPTGSRSCSSTTRAARPSRTASTCPTPSASSPTSTRI